MWVLSALMATAAGTDFRVGEDVTIRRDEVVHDDLYVAGQFVRIDGTVYGDVLVAAERLTVGGRVEGDLQAVARTVSVPGDVSDDARVLAELVQVGGTVGDDLLAAGFGLEAQDGSDVGGSTSFAGYQLLLDGRVGEDVRGAASAVRLRGSVDGGVDLRVHYPEDQIAPPDYGAPLAMPRPAPGMEVGDGASIGGDLVYRAPEAGRIEGGVAGTTDHHTVPFSEDDRPTNAALAVMRRFLALMVAGLAMVGLLPTLHGQLVDQVRQYPGRSLRNGLLAVLGAGMAGVAVVIATILLAGVLGVVTFGGLSGAAVLVGMLAEGTLVTTFVLLTGWVAPLPVMFHGGSLLLRPFRLETPPGRGWVLLAGLVPYVLLTAIPVVGGLLDAVVTLLGLGAAATLAMLAWSR